jgi:hypothetical protein
MVESGTGGGWLAGYLVDKVDSLANPWEWRFKFKNFIN